MRSVKLSNTFTKISVIIPVFNNELAHLPLIDFFNAHNYESFEVIVCQGHGRANAMNNGALNSSGEYLWFVHADTDLNLDHINALKNALKIQPNALQYFDLKFANDGPILTQLNGALANLRSRYLGLPWGDQALCLSRKIFDDIGKYDETLAYGEDHILVWRARHKGIKLNRIPLKITTSARKYKDRGWLALTLKRQFMWIGQALPEWWKWIIN